MFCPQKNSFLQLQCAMDPRIINKAVSRAMRKKRNKLSEDDIPPARRLESTQPSLFGPCLDVTEALLGFGRNGLRIINRDLNSDDTFIKLQAVHTMLDQVQIAENALFLINLNVVYRLIDLMEDQDPIVREKVLLILKHLATHLEGRLRIISRPIFIDRLIYMFMRDRKEIRYAASHFLKTLTRYEISCAAISQHEKIVESLIKMIKNDHAEIVIFHLNSLKNLSAIDPVKSLKANAFLVTKSLMIYHLYRIVHAAMNCMTQLCKHEVGLKLADKHDMTKFLLSYLVSPDEEVIVSAVGLMCYTTLTTESLWLAKKVQSDLIGRLMTFCASHNQPVLQLRAMQVLINLCACPDIRAYIKKRFEYRCEKEIPIRSNETWDGTKEVTTFGFQTGLNYRTMCIEPVETMEEDKENTDPVKVECYLSTIQKVKERLMEAMNIKPGKT